MSSLFSILKVFILSVFGLAMIFGCSAKTEIQQPTSTPNSLCNKPTNQTSNSSSSNSSNKDDDDDEFADDSSDEKDDEKKEEDEEEDEFALARLALQKGQPVFDGDIEDDIEDNCVSCHDADGNEPKLESWEDVEAAKKQVVSAIVNERMPPTSDMDEEERDKFKAWGELGYPKTAGDVDGSAPSNSNSNSSGGSNNNSNSDNNSGC